LVQLQASKLVYKSSNSEQLVPWAIELPKYYTCYNVPSHTHPVPPSHTHPVPTYWMCTALYLLHAYYQQFSTAINSSEYIT